MTRLTEVRIDIPTKAVLGVVVTVVLGVVSWFLLGHIEYGNRLSRLEDSASNDSRQDAELLEIRATMRDLIRLTAELAGRDRPLRPPFAAETVAAPLPVVEDPVAVETPVETLDPEYGEFRVEQSDLESILRGRGIEPAEKYLPDR